MKEEQLEKKNKRIEVIRMIAGRLVKFIYLLALITFLEIQIWRKVGNIGLGIGREVDDPFVFLPLTLCIFLLMRILNKYWFSLIDIWGITWYGLLIYGSLWLI